MHGIGGRRRERLHYDYGCDGVMAVFEHLLADIFWWTPLP